MRFLWILALLFSGVWAADELPSGCRAGAEVGSALECARERFYFGGFPVHPLIVRELMSLPSDGGDEVVAVNLSDAQGSNRYCCLGEFDILEEGGILRVDLDFQRHYGAEEKSAAECVNGCWFSYSRIGTDDDGAQILVVRQRTGGTGIFSSLLVLRVREYGLGLSADPDGGSYRVGGGESGSRILLEKIGEVPLGSGARFAVRLSGVIAEAEGESVRIVRP